MSTVKANRVQLGQSGTATQNFTFDASAANGTAKLARGNAGATTQDLMEIDGAGKVTFPAGSEMIGVAQTWQDVLASRAANTAYTNTTGKPIQVNIVTQTTSTSNNIQARVGTVIVAEFGITATNNPTTSSFIVPNGDTYRMDVANATILRWAELR